MSEWRPIEIAPKGVKLLCAYRNALGKWRRIIARYYLPNTLEANEESENAFAPEGWYEESETREEIEMCETPLLWQPLPELPK